MYEDVHGEKKYKNPKRNGQKILSTDTNWISEFVGWKKNMATIWFLQTYTSDVFGKHILETMAKSVYILITYKIGTKMDVEAG